jgi:phage baseplate assembly protein W
MAYEIKVNTDKFTPNVAVGVKLPIVTKSGHLFDLSYSTQDQVISNLKNLILTRRGERLMQPLFGTTVTDALFEQDTDILKESITSSITNAINFWLPYITINQLDVQTVVAVGPTNEEHGVTIHLVVGLNGQQANIPLTFLVTATGVQVI